MSNFSSRQVGICTRYRNHSLIQRTGLDYSCIWTRSFFKEISTVLKKPACKCTIALMEMFMHWQGWGFFLTPNHTTRHSSSISKRQCGCFLYISYSRNQRLWGERKTNYVTDRLQRDGKAVPEPKCGHPNVLSHPGIRPLGYRISTFF